jgi:glycosyltransferase involved in cell wall biosynthesis
MRQAHVFALLADTSFHDGLPNVVLEAMASGRPVIVSPLPAAGEAVTHGVEGFVLSGADDTAGVIHALRTLQEAPSLLRQLGAAARRRVEMDHDANVQIDRLASLFRSHAQTAVVSQAL